MKHAIQLQTLGGWGAPSPPAFAFDLAKGALVKGAGSGVRRYGKAPSSSDDDTRPLAPAYRHAPGGSFVSRGSYTAESGQLASLRAAPDAFGGAAGLSYVDARSDEKNAFVYARALGANESFAFRAFIDEIDGDGKEVNGHIWHLRIGKTGAGVLFQVRDGRAEIARMSVDWTRASENQLRLLWALESPTAAEETQIETLTAQIYSTFESLSFERSTSRDAWRGSAFFLTLIPEPRGAFHIVLEGADATCIEFDDLIERETVVNLWDEGSAVEVGATGGAWHFQPLRVRFGSATLTYGPFQADAGGGAVFGNDVWNDVVYSALAQSQMDDSDPPEPLATVDFERELFGETSFKFKATFSSTDARYGAWLYGLSARLDGGERTGLDDTDVSFDSADVPDMPHPVVETSVTCDEEGKRIATVTLWDALGRVSMAMPGSNIGGVIGRVANVSIASNGGASRLLFTQALVSRGRLENARAFAAQFGGDPRRLGIDVSKGDTMIELSICDGWQILEETPCDPPPVGDGQTLGYQIRALLGVAGFGDEERALVDEDFGRVLPVAAPGDEWASVPDADDSVAGAIGGLLDRFGLGVRFYQNGAGVWVLEDVPTNVVAAFTSSAAGNDPLLIRGGTRLIILEAFDWERDNSDFHNVFRVVGGKGGEITREWVDAQSFRRLGGDVLPPRWVGRRKPYPTLRDTGLRTEADVNYALRSLRFRYGQPGRLATFESYAHFDFVPGDRVTLDGVLCEMLAWEARATGDAGQYRVREIV